MILHHNDTDNNGKTDNNSTSHVNSDTYDGHEVLERGLLEDLS